MEEDEVGRDGKEEVTEARGLGGGEEGEERRMSLIHFVVQSGSSVSASNIFFL